MSILHVNEPNALRALQISLKAQHLHDVTVSPQKHAAKERGGEIVRQHLAGKPEAKILDLGSEAFYQKSFPPMDQLNLPEDMHALDRTGVYDAVVAMHVLEHSPFPLLVLLNIHQALKPGGFMYAAVPRPVEPFLSMPSHFTVLEKAGWEKLFNHAGLHVKFAESGRFGDYDPATEERFVCTKQP